MKTADQYQAEKLAEFRENFPTLYHGSTAFDETSRPITLETARGRWHQKIFASHDIRIAATYAAVIKDHPHADVAIPGIESPIMFLVIDHKEDYLARLKDKKKLLFEFSSAGFSPDAFGLSTVVEWHGAQNVTVTPDKVREYSDFDEILEEGVQVFFTTESSCGTGLMDSIRKELFAPIFLRKMIQLNHLEWANQERQLSPAQEFVIGFL